jgi:glucokinase
LPRAAIALLGAGTGLGASGLLPVGRDAYVPITGEGGHVTLAPGDDRESAVLERLRHRYGHASAERALSGPGLVNLYVAVCELNGRAVQALSPAEVIAQARGEGGGAVDACCATALELFFNFLGGVAGNLALTLGARGGVYIGGGIAPRLLPEMGRSAFRERFEGKGRFRDYLRGIPTLVIDAEVSPAFIGASRALDMDADAV